MHLLAVFSVFGVALLTHGFTVREFFAGVKANIRTDLEAVGDETEMSHGQHKGHCSCGPWGCWCHAVDAGVKVHAVFSVLEFRDCKCKSTIIDGTFYVGKESFTKEFPVDKFEDFCEEVNGKEFCFEIDVSHAKCGKLEGSVRLTRPQRVDMGHFSLNLVSSEEPSEDIDCIQDDAHSDVDSSVSEMEESAELDAILAGKSGCYCEDEHGCICNGEDDGYKVSVILSVDECHHGGSSQAIVYGFFRVDKTTFFKQFHEDELDDFCEKVEGKKFCFDIDIKHTCRCHIAGSIKLTKPRQVDLGKFDLPLLTASIDDEAKEDDVIPFHNEDIEANGNDIQID